MFSDVEG